MNVISISGNLGKDCEVRALNDGTPVASFSVADSQGKDKPAIWWNCSLFGKRADTLSQYLTKGQQVTVNGTVSEREYTDKDGQKRKVFDIRVNDVALQGGRRDEQQPQTQQRPAPTRPTKTVANGDFDDDIPF